MFPSKWSVWAWTLSSSSGTASGGGADIATSLTPTIILFSSLASALAFLGLPAGQFLAGIAAGEVAAGKRYFSSLRLALFGLLAWLGTASRLPFALQLICVGFLLLLMVKAQLFRLSFGLWGLLLGLNAAGNFPLLASLVFIYGLLEAALRRPDKVPLGIVDLLFFPLFVVGMMF